MYCFGMTDNACLVYFAVHPRVSATNMGRVSLSLTYAPPFIFIETSVPFSPTRERSGPRSRTKSLRAHCPLANLRPCELLCGLCLTFARFSAWKMQLIGDRPKQTNSDSNFIAAVRLLFFDRLFYLFKMLIKRHCSLVLFESMCLCGGLVTKICCMQ